MSYAQTVFSERGYTEFPVNTMGQQQRTLNKSIFYEDKLNVENWLQKSLTTLESLFQLQDNWNSYGSSKIRPASFIGAATLLAIIKTSFPDISEPSIIPTPKGTIQFEWHENNIDLEIDILGSNSFSLFLHDHATEKDFDEIVSFDLTLLQSAFTKLIS